jgi:hypothetical protein
MPTAKKKETDPFPVSPEQMKWPFRTAEERKKNHPVAQKAAKTAYSS